MPRFQILSSSVLVAGLLTFVSAQGSTQDLTFGQRGHVVLSAERLTGFVHSSQNTSAGGQESNQSVDVFFLFGNPAAAVTGYAWPRLALDSFVVPNISVGAAASFVNISPENGSATALVLAPRVGYAAHVGSRAAIWPRLGFTYVRVSSESEGFLNTSTTQSLFALTMEVPIVIVLAPHATFTIGPTVDLGLGGSGSIDGAVASVDQKFTEIGFQGGISVYF